MCLAVPMKIKSVDGFNALCEAKGIEREVSLFMLQGEDVAPGDHVLVHVGYAIQKVSEEDARLAWELFDEIENFHRLFLLNVISHSTGDEDYPARYRRGFLVRQLHHNGKSLEYAVLD